MKVVYDHTQRERRIFRKHVKPITKYAQNYEHN